MSPSRSFHSRVSPRFHGVSPSSARGVCRRLRFMACVALKFVSLVYIAFYVSWGVSPSSVHGVCRRQVFMACVAFKCSWRLSPSSTFSWRDIFKLVVTACKFGFWRVSPSKFVFSAVVVFIFVFMGCVTSTKF